MHLKLLLRISSGVNLSGGASAWSSSQRNSRDSCVVVFDIWRTSDKVRHLAWCPGPHLPLFSFVLLCYIQYSLLSVHLPNYWWMILPLVPYQLWRSSGFSPASYPLPFYQRPSSFSTLSNPSYTDDSALHISSFKTFPIFFSCMIYVSSHHYQTQFWGGFPIGADIPLLNIDPVKPNFFLFLTLKLFKIFHLLWWSCSSTDKLFKCTRHLCNY